MNIPLLVAGVAAVVVSLVVRAAKAKNALEPEEDDEGSGVFLSPPAGFRRAKQAEVTPAMSSKAREMLSQPLGTLAGPFTNENGVAYYIAVETHSNAPKGSSVFIQR